MTRRFLVLIALLAVIPAFAADKPKLVVLPFVAADGATDAQASRFTSVVNDEFKGRDETVQWLTPPAVSAKGSEKGSVATGAAAKKSASPEVAAAFNAGKKALDDLKFEEAISQLQKGIELGLSDPATADFPSILEAHVSLAVAAFRMGDDQAAKNALNTIARLGKDYSLPPGYPPVFTREFDKAKKRAEKAARGSLSIEGPSGATAFIDGRDLGMVPVMEEGLPAGSHYVRVESSKGERFGQTVEVKSGVAKVKIAGTPGSAAPVAPVASSLTTDPKIGGTLDDGMLQRTAAFTAAAGADFTLVGVVFRTSDSQLTAGTALYSARKNGFVALPPIAFDADVLTANVEAFRLAEEALARVAKFPAVGALPMVLITKSVGKGGTEVVAQGDVAPVVAERKAIKPKNDAERPVLVPKEKDNTVVAEVERPIDEPGPQEVKKGVPTWVWVVSGVAVAAGAAVGTYFIYTGATRPVTGTVTASW